MEERRAQPIQAEPTIRPVLQDSVEAPVVPQEGSNQGSSTNSSNEVLQDVLRVLDDIKKDNAELRQQLRKGSEAGKWTIEGTGISATDGNPYLSVVSDALGLEASRISQNYDILSSVCERVVAIIGSSNPADIFDYITHDLRSSPYNQSLRSYARRIEIRAKELGIE